MPGREATKEVRDDTMRYQIEGLLIFLSASVAAA